MNINIGDEVYFFWGSGGDFIYRDERNTVLIPHALNLIKCRIVDVSEAQNFVYVYVNCTRELGNFSYRYYEKYLFRTKELAIKALRNQIDQLESE